MASGPKFSTPAKIIIATALSLIVILLVLVLLRPGHSNGQITMQSSGKAAIGGDFTLVDDDGGTFTQADLQGRPSLIYFGYTFCPDVCPFSLQAMRAALDKLPAKQRKKVRTVFITVDPARDTVAEMHQYVQSDAFPAGLIGLTGTPEQVKTAEDAYKIYSAKVTDDGSSAQYLVDHTSLIFLMDENGEFVTAFTHSEPPETIAQRIKKYFAAQ